MRRSVRIWPLMLAIALFGMLAWTPTRELYVAACQSVGGWFIQRIMDSLPT
jgi:hypothetical protein